MFTIKAASVAQLTPASKTDVESSTSARDKVLGVAELFDGVLSQVEEKELLLLQRVCKSWKLIIDKSPIQQERLFLRPANVERAFKIKTKVQHSYHASGEKQETKKEVVDYYRTDGPIAPGDLMQAKPNPALCVAQSPFAELLTDWSVKIGDIQSRASRGECLEIQPSVMRHARSAEGDGVPHSYLNMFITQPPVTRLVVRLRECKGDSELILYPSGIRFRDVLRACSVLTGVGLKHPVTVRLKITGAIMPSESEWKQFGSNTITPIIFEEPFLSGMVQVGPGEWISADKAVQDRFRNAPTRVNQAELRREAEVRARRRKKANKMRRLGLHIPSYMELHPQET